LKMQAFARQIKELRGAGSSEKLSATLAKSDASKMPLQSITDILSELDPEIDSVAFLFLLHAALALNGNNTEALLTGMYFNHFCAFFGAAGSHSSDALDRDRLYTVARTITDACTKVRSSPHVLAAAQAICKFVASSQRVLSTISQLHIDALQLTLLGASLSPLAQHTSVLRAVLPIMSDDILFPFEDTPAAPQKSDSKEKSLRIQEHVLAYFYYSGCVFCGLSNFESAADRFFLCVSAGGHIVQSKEQRDSFGREHTAAVQHEIVDAAQKKLVLACLLSDNDDLSCLKHIPVPPARAYNSSDDSLVTTFSSCRKGKGSLTTLRQMITRNYEVFERDGNVELVMRLQDAFLLHIIRAQSSIHDAVNVLQLCQDLNLPDSVKIPDCIQTLIDQGKLKATLQGNKLTFSHETDGSAELRLKALSARAVSLEQQLQHEVRRTELQRSKVTVGRP